MNTSLLSLPVGCQERSSSSETLVECNHLSYYFGSDALRKMVLSDV